jgi:uncharacterized protein (DUF362 family)
MSESKPGGVSRRELLSGATALAAGAGLLAATRGRAEAAASGANRADPGIAAPAREQGVVGLSRDASVVGNDGRVRADGVQALFDGALVAATGAADPTGALKMLFKPADVVGIKINCLAGRGLSTHAELVDAIVARLVGAGVKADHIVVWDRSDRDLKRAGYAVRRSGAGPRYFGTNDDYENEPIEAGSVGGCLSKILTRTVTAVINVPVLKDHDLAGISGALKSFYGAIHNPNRYHDNNCNPYIADLYAHPAIRDRVKLTVFDALTAQFHGGPAWVPDNCWSYGAVFASLDPVAADSTALDIIADKRRQQGLEPLDKAGRPAAWLPLAERRGLGVADAKHIRTVGR